jgi:hypothetical protein
VACLKSLLQIKSANAELFLDGQGFYRIIKKNNMNEKTDSTLVMLTLSEQIKKAEGEGYSENFNIEAKRLKVVGENDGYTAEQIKISNFYRFEGQTDPQDSSILYLIETADGKKGTLVDAYGAYADADISNFIREVEDIHKKAKKQ